MAHMFTNSILVMLHVLNFITDHRSSKTGMESSQGHIRQRGKILQLSVIYDISPQNKLETC